MKAINNYIKKAILLGIALGLLFAGITYVFGVQGATDISVGTSSRASFNESSGQYTAVQAGNVTELNISGTAITDHWAGFYGDIEGSITLSNSNGNVFYNWSGINSVAGEVFASNETAVAWAGIGCPTGDESVSIEESLGITPTDADRINATYTGNSHPDITVADVALSGCNTTNAFVSTGSDSSSFYQILLTDTNGAPVYTALINESTTGFDGNAHDFQLLVGESDVVGTTNLFFYIELT